SARCRDRGEGVPQVVQTHVIESGSLANRLPWRLQVRERGANLVADDDMRIGIEPGQIGQDGEGRGRQVQGLRARLAVGKPCLTPLEVNPVPPEAEHFAFSRPGEYQKLDGGNRVWRALEGRQRIPKPRQLDRREHSLSLNLPELLDMATWV